MFAAAAATTGQDAHAAADKGPGPGLGDEIVISGIAGVFPKCDNVLEFGEKLLAKEDLISETGHYYASGEPKLLHKLLDTYTYAHAYAYAYIIHVYE